MTHRLFTFALIFLPVVASGKTEKIIKLGGGELQISFVAESKSQTSPKASSKTSEEAQLRWIEKAAKAVSTYYGRYPVKKVLIEVKQDGEGNHIGGTTWSGKKIQLRLGDGVTANDLEDDWTATHEMFHLAFPELDDKFVWMGEGLATYLEPLARARMGYFKVDQMWKEFVFGFPKGSPADDDQGLDSTDTWGRTYWGGAAFWFEADLKIREGTKNKKSLDTACRAILDHGGDGSAEWTVDNLIKVADDSTGLNVISELHNRMGAKPGWDDLNEIWKRMGISFPTDHVVYDPKAPLARMRKEMTVTGSAKP